MDRCAKSFACGSAKRGLDARAGLLWRGGTEPTITDANLLLGRLNPENFLGGEMRLDIGAAKRALAERIALPLGYAGENGMIQMADGVISIAIVIMAGAIRKISVEHGSIRGILFFSATAAAGRCTRARSRTSSPYQR
jgi:N-methylhydantoinase A